MVCFDQCDQIGRFLIVLGDKFFWKVAQISLHFWGYFKNNHFLIKTVVATFWQLLKSLGYFRFQDMVTLQSM